MANFKCGGSNFIDLKLKSLYKPSPHKRERVGTSADRVNHFMKCITIVFATMLLTIALHATPTPSAPQDKQPTCLAGAFAILSAEVMDTNISAITWESRMAVTNEMVVAMDGIHVWESQFPSNKFELVYSYSDTNEYATPYHTPLLWIGKMPAGNHAAVVYLDTTNVVIKHFLYNPSTHTNYCESLSYDKFFERTFFVLKIHH